MTKGRTPSDVARSGPGQGSLPLDASLKVQHAIGRALEAHYVELVREPIPERLLELLAKLEAGDLRHE